MTAITLDRPARELLRAEVGYTVPMSDFDAAVDNLARDEALELLDQARFVIDVLDALGWEEESDEVREIAVKDPERWRGWLVTLRGEVERGELKQDVGRSVDAVLEQLSTDGEEVTA